MKISRRLASLVLIGALACGLAAPAAPAAAAAEGVDQQLAQVTAKVKQTLSIGDSYREFNGEPQEDGLKLYWSLRWSDEGDSLWVEADPDGKVSSYHRNLSGTPSSSGSIPSFPQTDRETARQTATAFLRRVLTEGETAFFRDNTRSNSRQHYFSGVIQFNGLPSPVTFSLTVNADLNQVIRFSRSDRHLGDVPSGTPASGADSAAQLLKEVQSLRLEYVRDEDQTQAVLRYLPDEIDDYYVDAQSGERVSLDELYEALVDKGYYLFGRMNGNAAPEADMATADAGGGNIKDMLSQAEQDGVAKLKGVLTREQLHQRLWSVQGLALDGMGLTGSSYWLDSDEDRVFAHLSYADKTDPDQKRLTVTVDARTVEIQSINSSVPYDEDRSAVLTADQAREKAVNFLTSIQADRFAKTELIRQSEDLPEGLYTFTYAQKVNGYFFPENQFTIGVDVEDGSIRMLDWNFDDSVTFQSADGLISADAALDAWFDSYTVTLGYRNIPTALHPGQTLLGAADLANVPEYQRCYYALRLAYYLEREQDCSGVDAKTGALVQSEQYDAPRITYSDLEGHWAAARLTKLAEYGVGFYGGTFQPDKALTQLDLLALLLSTQGYTIDLSEPDAADTVYRAAYDMGLLTAAERDDSAALTRAQTVKFLIDCIGYGEVAQLDGIFRCSFQDADSIPAQYYGYAALAQGMGLVSGDSDGAFAPNRPAARVDAAVMLYNYMNR